MPGWLRRVWAMLDWRRAAAVEWDHRRGAAAMLDEHLEPTETAPVVRRWGDGLGL